MNSKQINELLASENHSTVIAELKNGRNATEPNAAEYIAQLDPQGHDVNDPVKRRDKKVKVDLSDFDINDEEKEEHKDRYQWRRGNRKLPYRAGSPRSFGDSETYSKAGRSLHVRKPRNP